METKLNKKLISCVLENIPRNVKPVVYLVNTLNISRESAYRRIRGEIPFTAQELVKLAMNLEFSIDSTIEQEKQDHSFFDFSKDNQGSSDFFLFMLKRCNQLLKRISSAESSEVFVSLNTFTPPFCTGFDNLFKFIYCKWLYQDNKISVNQTYSDVVLPEEMALLQRRIKGNLFHGKSNVFIFDVNIFLNLIKDIHYFYQRRLISGEEMEELKEEVISLINFYEEIALTGIADPILKAKIQVYLSTLCISSNVAYYEYDDQMESVFWAFTVNPIIIQSKELNLVQKKWLNSLKRQSALITQSNEIMQADFFFQQREYANKYLSV